MASHNLSIFRGRITFKTHVGKIIGVLILLSIITVVEVILGIIRPEALLASFAGMKILNWIFIILTIVKAYYITWDFMHVRDEKGSLKAAIILPLMVLIPYLIFILLVEGNYVFETLREGFQSWNF